MAIHDGSRGQPLHEVLSADAGLLVTNSGRPLSWFYEFKIASDNMYEAAM